ncbi:MAG: AAA family ATPase, partial [Thermomicrobium sp.]
MIPTRLELRQFLCYRDPVEVDFTGLRLACLCGENGAGKSALLDAITWALWEQARAGNTHLVSLGELETRVEFSFVLDGTEYRVIRGYTAAGRTRSLLELHVRRDDGWYPLASGGKSAVQREIDRLLGISYTTFVNSVFLLQGKADEFTRKTPAERKRILAELLELDRYERYRELARDEGKRLREERIRREQELELLRTRAEMVPILQAQVRELDEVVRLGHERLTRSREHLAARQERLQRLKLEVTRYQERQRQQRELTHQLERLREEESRLAQDLQRYQHFLRREADILQRASELERIRRELDE